jgi:hypothetical protein
MVTPVVVLEAWTEWSDCTHFAEETKTQYYEDWPFFAPVAGIDV